MSSPFLISSKEANLWTKALKVTGGPIQNIMIASDRAKLTTNMLVGVLRVLVWIITLWFIYISN